MNFQCLDDLSAHLHHDAAQGAPPVILPELCPEGMDGDLTVNCFRAAKDFHLNPMALADQAVAFLGSHPDVEKVDKVKAFVNLRLKAAALHRQTAAAAAALATDKVIPDAERSKILVEYSAPNTNKPLHLGHLRNNCLGMALCSMLRRAGHDVVAVNLINDRGIHICKSMLAYQRYGDGATPESAGKKGDHLVGDYYVKFDTELRAQLAALREQRPELAAEDNEKLFGQTEIGAAAQDTLRRWEARDPATLKLWETMNRWVIDGFGQTYKRMGVKFDRVYLESQTYTLGKDVIQDGLARGVFHQRPDGAIFADLKQYKLDTKVLLRSDGTSVYITQDIGTTLEKYKEYHPDKMVWVVGDEQIHHFKTLFAILSQLGHPWAADLHHLAYGMVNLPSGKMKSREGTVVDADNLFDEMFTLAKDATLERCGDDVPADLDVRSETIAQGALKFMLLKFNPKSTIMFDPGASIKFEGDTGPYVQYACARIKSIARKAAERGFEFPPKDVDWSLLDSKWECAVSCQLSQYQQTLRLAADKLDTSGLVAYSLELAKSFNAFYRECPVLVAESPALRQARLALSAAVMAILEDILTTLTIPVPDAM